jgi:hypothetical protein
MVHGGYINIEFARDVIMQSPEFLTTQENIAAFLNRTYNSPLLVQDWGKPVCVVNTGHHDMAIPNITIPKFLSNVEWYLNLLNPHCSSIVWLSTTAPQTEQYFQKVNDTLLCNQGVQGILSRSHELRTKSVFVDVFEASRSWPHRDNIHMDSVWYAKLGQLLTDFSTTKCSLETAEPTFGSPL